MAKTTKNRFLLEATPKPPRRKWKKLPGRKRASARFTKMMRDVEASQTDKTKRAFSAKQEQAEKISHEELEKALKKYLVPGTSGIRRRIMRVYVAPDYFKLHLLAVTSQRLTDGTASSCNPEIESVVLPYSQPGDQITIHGACFGEHVGTVWFKLGNSSAPPQPMIVQSWSDVAINVLVPQQFKKLIFDGWIQVERGDGDSSQQFPHRFIPTYDTWQSSITESHGPNLFGKDVDATFLKGCQIDSPALFRHVARSHYGNGHSHFRNPHAIYRWLRQGYHIGLKSMQRGSVQAVYSIVSPRGYNPYIYYPAEYEGRKLTFFPGSLVEYDTDIDPLTVVP